MFDLEMTAIDARPGAGRPPATPLGELTRQFAAAADFDGALAVAAGAMAALLPGNVAVAAAFDPAVGRWFVQAAGEPAVQATRLASQLHARLHALADVTPDVTAGSSGESGPTRGAAGVPGPGPAPVAAPIPGLPQLSGVTTVLAGAGATVVEVQLPPFGGILGLVATVYPPGTPGSPAAPPGGQVPAAPDQTTEQNLAIIVAHTVLSLRALSYATRLAAMERQQQEQHEFLSLVTHDLRTPLASIRGYAQLLLRQQGASHIPLHRTGLHTIVEQTDRLAALTDTLLDVARIQARRMTLRRVTADVGQIVRQAAAQQQRPETPMISIIGPESGPLLIADTNRLTQITRLLLSFAIERTPKGGEVSLRVLPHGVGVQLVLDDAGPALEPSQCTRLFDQLVMASDHGSGRALGHIRLYVARGLAEAHGGWVLAESPVPGRDLGTRLSLWLPGGTAPESPPRPGTGS